MKRRLSASLIFFFFFFFFHINVSPILSDNICMRLEVPEPMISFKMIPRNRMRKRKKKYVMIILQFSNQPRSAVCSASDSRARGHGFDTRSGHILSHFLPLIQEGQLSVTGKSMCTEYWLNAWEV